MPKFIGKIFLFLETVWEHISLFLLLKMKKEFFKINNIPAVLWGETSEKIIIAVHGNMSHKEDIPIEILAEIGNQKNYQILSFDLPEHGERKT